MDDPDVPVQLEGVDDPEGISAKWQSYLEYAGTHPVQRLRNIRLSAFRHDAQRRQADRLGTLRELLERP
jgi:hypothetical protein